MTDVLILLDINGILGYKSEDEVLGRDDVKCGNYFFCFYTGVKEFIQNLREKYTVGIFSSTRYFNVSTILGVIDPNFKKNFTPLMDRSMTSFDPDYDIDDRIKEFDTVKYLKTFWENPVHNADRKWSENNTIIIDDSIMKVRFNDDRNILIITEFVDYETLLQQIEEKVSLL